MEMLMMYLYLSVVLVVFHDKYHSYMYEIQSMEIY